jgi:hypothetical protein
MSHLIEMSNITTRANNQFPRPDFHRLDKQPYRLQPFGRGTPCFLRQGSETMRISSASPPNTLRRGRITLAHLLRETPRFAQGWDVRDLPLALSLPKRDTLSKELHFF